MKNGQGKGEEDDEEEEKEKGRGGGGSGVGAAESKKGGLRGSALLCSAVSSEGYITAAEQHLIPSPFVPSRQRPGTERLLAARGSRSLKVGSFFISSDAGWHFWHRRNRKKKEEEGEGEEGKKGVQLCSD